MIPADRHRGDGPDQGTRTIFANRSLSLPSREAHRGAGGVPGAVAQHPDPGPAGSATTGIRGP